MKSGYVVKGCTVRGDWNTAKRIAVQIRYKSGTEPVQNWDRTGTKLGQKWDRSETEVGQKWDRSGTCAGRGGGEKLGPAAPLSHHRGGLSDRVHLEGWGKIPKQAAGCKNRPKPYSAGSGPKTASEALQTFRR